MQNSLYVSLSGQVALQKRLETISTNIANMDTAGYRADGVTFAAILADAGDTSVSYTSAGSTYISRKTGEMTKTDNPLDVAVMGDAWIGISTPSGTVYTRDGRMRMNPGGGLETLNGHPVLDAGGTALLLDPNGGPPTIAHDGMITQNGTQVGAIGLFSIDPGVKLTRADNSGVIPAKAATAVLDFNTNGITQGFVEGSNVNPVLEMTKLITVSRAFDGLVAATNQSDTSLQDAIKTLGSTT